MLHTITAILLLAVTAGVAYTAWAIAHTAPQEDEQP